MISQFSTSTALAVLLGAALVTSSVQEPADVKVTQKYLVPTCLDGAAVKSDTRRWKLSPGEHSMAFTMRNNPRKGTPTAPPDTGVAVINFIPEVGHKYEIETRAESTTFSMRVWERGAWSPVVRDRTANRVVSTTPVWTEGVCRP